MKQNIRIAAVLACIAGFACADSVSHRSDPPTPVSLYPAYGQTATSLILTWSTNNETDFVSYTLLRSQSADVTDVSGTVATTIEDYLSANHTDTGLLPETTYHYRLKVTNTKGLSSFSNEIAATTLADPDNPQAPEPVTLSPAANIIQTALSLNWTVSTAGDFASYTVLRGDSPGLTEANATAAATYEDALTVDHREEGLTHSTTCTTTACWSPTPRA